VTAGNTAIRPGHAELERLLVQDNAALGRGASAQERRRHGLGLLLGWLDGAEGSSWQARWVQLGEPADWQAAAGATTKWQRLGMTAALTSLLCHRILHPATPGCSASACRPFRSCCSPPPTRASMPAWSRRAGGRE
jgi:hypothetical protein